MSTVTLRLPDEKHRRLKSLAKARRVSVNKLIDEWATIALAAHDAEQRFRAMAARGNRSRAMALLDKLDAAGSRR
jgi:hypothetical protein